ncbi:MAG: hypothetical protein IJZ37_05640, partial [Clostridia bacterium]|nr:hypothetical protein [Clostridia bacterium]
MESNPALTRVDYLQLDTLREDLKKVKQSIWNKNARLKDVFERVRSDYNNKTAVSLIEDLQREYQALSESKDEYISAAYSEHVYNHLDILKKSLEEDQKGVTVRAMSESQLAEMLDALRMIEYTVSKANKLFREGRTENFEEWVTESRMQIVENGKQGKDLPKNIKAAGDAAAGFLWNELKPFYAFERLGSKRLQTLFWDILEGEQRAAVIQENAKVFIEEKRKQYGISDDVLGKTETFVLADGSTFTLNISDMMSIYAYSKREQAMKHMLEGGFVFGNQNYYKKTVGFIKKHTEKMDSEKAREIIDKIATVEYSRAVDAKPQTLSEGMLNTIIEEIKKDAKLKGFADALQDYMTDLGRAGNETSRVLYGIDLFNEKHYIPIRSSKDYMNHVAMEMGQTVTSASVANMGMTRKTVPKANNPIVLESFVELFSDHTRQMSNYVGLAVPIDNMRRVLTFVSRASSEQNATSTLALIESHFSKGAKSYFDQYLRDVNGNAVKPSGYQSPLFEQFGRSKKVAVAASLSVAVQQPTSILRAGAEIDPKYLLHSMGNIHVKSTWKELNKHAPIAIIKEIGGFDVGDAGRANRYISGKQTFMTKADDVFTTLATLGDEYGWGVIWSAVKKEAADTTKLKPGTDAFFEHCRKRFTEIIVKTQVYDSVNARSGMMRSQSDIVKLGTSFMGEPTVFVNQLDSAAMKVIKTKGKDKAALKHAFATIGALLASGVLNSALKSIIYAMRDDDEDEAFWEKYLQALGRSIASDINPLNWLPFMRDVVSILEGWSVEQADLTLLADVVTSAKKVASTLIKGEDITLKQFLDLLGALGNMLGLPVKNLIREVGGLIRMAKMVFIDDIVVNDAEDLLTSFWRGGVMSSLVGELTESEKLYDALRDHDEARLDYYKKD